MEKKRTTDAADTAWYGGKAQRHYEEFHEGKTEWLHVREVLDVPDRHEAESLVQHLFNRSKGT